MFLESKKRINDIVSVIDEIGMRGKHLNLKSAVQTLCDGYYPVPTENITAVTFESNDKVRLKCCENLISILNQANTKTGCNASTITEAVRNLINGFDAGQDSVLYRFGILSDLHIQYVTGIKDFQRALTYLKDSVSFTCIPGDLVAWAGTGSVTAYETTDYMAQYKACVDGYAGDMPIYECAGNHETYPEQGVSGTIDSGLWTETTGKQLYYSFEFGNDVFLFLSLKGTNVNDLFADGGLEWLEATLEANKNKRCFVFQHCPELSDRSADPSGTWSSLMEGTSGKAFIALMKKYQNLTWFHGHTHVTLEVDQYPVSDRDVLGYRSVHVPSLVSPRFYDEETGTLADSYKDENNNTIWGSLFSEGYIVDVYANKIVLRGINFAAGPDRDNVEIMENEIYALDTTLITTP